MLNTPFSLIRTIGKNVFVVPNYFEEEKLAQIYSPVHSVSDTTDLKKKNVVVLIVESFGREYIGAYNDYEGYTPFLDSLISKSLTWDM